MDMHDKHPDQVSFGRLTEKQRDVLALLADGRTSKEMARDLRISVSAVNQRIETLRHRMGGISRAELGRLYRASLSLGQAEPCKTITGDSLHLPQQTWKSDSLSPDDLPGRLHFADSMSFQVEVPWVARPGPEVVPRVLDGKNAGLIRAAAIAAIVVGIFVAMTLALAVAQGLTEMTDTSDPGQDMSQ